MSDYLSIWIFNSRPRMKVLFCYVLLFITVFVFSDIMIYLYTKSLYQPMEKYEVNIEAPQVTISVAEASNVNGNVKGTIKNTTQEKITDKYIRFDFYTPREVNVGTKYLKIDGLEVNEEKQFELGFKYDNVSFNGRRGRFTKSNTRRTRTYSSIWTSRNITIVTFRTLICIN